MPSVCFSEDPPFAAKGGSSEIADVRSGGDHGGVLSQTESERGSNGDRGDVVGSGNVSVKSGKSTASNSDESANSTPVPRRSVERNTSRRRPPRIRRSSSRRSSSRTSFFGDLSSSLYKIVVDPIIDNLQEEEVFRDDDDSMSFDSYGHKDELDEYYVPYLDDTMVTYNTRTRRGQQRKWCGAIVNHPYTQRAILLLITLNALLMGLMTFDFVVENENLMWYLVIVDWVILALFAVEVILQLIWHGRSTLRDPWLMFDVIILCCSWVPELRIFRFARVINRLAILKTLTRAIALVMPRMFSIALFLFLVIYIYAVLFTELFREVQFEGGVNYFETLPASMFTAFEMMTLEWANIARELHDQSFSWVPIITFVVICGFIFVNLVLAVICDAVAVIGVDWSGRNEMERQTKANLEAQMVDAQQRIHRLKELLTQLIKNQNSTLYLLEVQLAKQLNNVETLSNLVRHQNADVEQCTKQSTYKSRSNRKNMLSRLMQDYSFQEHNFLTKIRIVSGLTLESNFFECFIFSIICIDCILMGVATFDAVNESEHWIRVLDIISFVFLSIYTVEAAMGFIFLGWGVFGDAWMAFDVFIVVTSWIADLLQGLITFREFRAIRIVRAFRLIGALYQLRDLVSAIGRAIPRVSKVMPLLLLIFYIFAVLFVELFGDVQFDDGVNYFGRLDYALFTCLQMMTMEGWADIAREAMEKTGLWWTNFLFVLFVMVSGMLFFDLIKATVCDSVAVINGRSRRLADIKKSRKRLKRLAATVDNLSHQVAHTLNFQTHINRMMLNDLQTLASKNGQTKPGKRTVDLASEKGQAILIEKTSKTEQKGGNQSSKKRERTKYAPRIEEMQSDHSSLKGTKRGGLSTRDSNKPGDRDHRSRNKGKEKENNRGPVGKRKLRRTSTVDHCRRGHG